MNTQIPELMSQNVRLFSDSLSGDSGIKPTNDTPRSKNMLETITSATLVKGKRLIAPEPDNP
jgi:hypothetical protein